MYTIETKGENLFELLKDGACIGEYVSLEEAEKAKAEATSTHTWVDDGEGLEYPEGTDDYHSGEETPLTFEQRFDAVLRHFATVHGIHLPAHLAPKE